MWSNPGPSSVAAVPGDYARCDPLCATCHAPVIPRHRFVPDFVPDRSTVGRARTAALTPSPPCGRGLRCRYTRPSRSRPRLWETSPSPVYGAALLMRFGFTAHPGFESRSLRPACDFISAPGPLAASSSTRASVVRGSLAIASRSETYGLTGGAQAGAGASPPHRVGVGRGRRAMPTGVPGVAMSIDAPSWSMPLRERRAGRPGLRRRVWWRRHGGPPRAVIVRALSDCRERNNGGTRSGRPMTRKSRIPTARGPVVR